MNVDKYSAVIGHYIGRLRVQQATGNDHLNSFPVSCLLVCFNSSNKLHQQFVNISPFILQHYNNLLITNKYFEHRKKLILRTCRKMINSPLQ